MKVITCYKMCNSANSKAVCDVTASNDLSISEQFCLQQLQQYTTFSLTSVWPLTVSEDVY